MRGTAARCSRAGAASRRHAERRRWRPAAGGGGPASRGPGAGAHVQRPGLWRGGAGACVAPCCSPACLWLHAAQMHTRRHHLSAAPTPLPQGICRLPGGFVVFVDRALPGERLTAQIVQQKKRWARAAKLASLAPHEHAVEPACQVCFHAPAALASCPASRQPGGLPVVQGLQLWCIVRSCRHGPCRCAARVRCSTLGPAAAARCSTWRTRPSWRPSSARWPTCCAAPRACLRARWRRHCDPSWDAPRASSWSIATKWSFRSAATSGRRSRAALAAAVAAAAAAAAQAPARLLAVDAGEGRQQHHQQRRRQRQTEAARLPEALRWDCTAPAATAQCCPSPAAACSPTPPTCCWRGWGSCAGSWDWRLLTLLLAPACCSTW